MTTNIDDLLEQDTFENVQDAIPESGDLYENIMDMSLTADHRLNAFQRYYYYYDDNTIEIINRLASMYFMTASRNIEEFFTLVCLNSSVSFIVKLESAKTLVGYEEYKDTNIQANNIAIDDRNAERKNNAYNCLYEICKLSETIECNSSSRLEAIHMLYRYNDRRVDAISCMKRFTCDTSIDAEFRYRSILSLQVLFSNIIKDAYASKYDNTKFLKHVKSRLPDIGINSKTKVHWEVGIGKLLTHVSYIKLTNIYNDFFTNKIHNHEETIKKLMTNFFYCKTNDISFRILAGQYIIIHFELERPEVQQELILIARDHTINENTRADAADVLLNNGDEEYISVARNIVHSLGMSSRITDIYTNKQNVHDTSIQQSVLDIIECLVGMDLITINGNVINFEHVKKEILETRKITDKSIKFSLTRIELDKTPFTYYKITLSTIIVLVWNYIHNNTHKEEMIKRLLEELHEMNGTCSTGYVSRLVNTLSGFGEMSIRISYEEQIYTYFLNYINMYMSQIQTNPLFIDNINSIRGIIQEDVTDEEIIESFFGHVMSETSNNTNDYTNRKHVNLFLIIVLPRIKEDLYNEFKDYVSDEYFDRSLKMSVIKYQDEI